MQEKTTTTRLVSDITGEKLNQNQAASLRITVGTKVYVLDAEKANEHVAALIAASPSTENKRGRKAGSKNEPQATEATTEAQEATTETETPTEA